MSSTEQSRRVYFAFACLLYSVWRVVDLLVRVDLTGEYNHSPIVTADNTLTPLKKETRVGETTVQTGQIPVFDR